MCIVFQYIIRHCSFRRESNAYRALSPYPLLGGSVAYYIACYNAIYSLYQMLYSTI